MHTLHQRKQCSFCGSCTVGEKLNLLGTAEGPTNCGICECTCQGWPIAIMHCG